MMYPRLEGADVTFLVGDHSGAEGVDRAAGWDTRRWDLKWRFTGIEDGKQVFKHLQGYRRLRSYLRQCSPDQLHAGRPLSEGFVAALACPRNIPLVCYVHGEDISVARTSRQLTMATRWTLSRCTRLIANSTHTLNMLTDDWQVPLEKISLIHPGVDCEKFVAHGDRAGLRTQLGFADRKVVLTVGRLQRRKGQDTAIHAVRHLRERYPDLLWVFAGDGEDAEYLQGLVDELQVHHHVNLLGAIDDLQLAQLYQAADLFVLPNRTEGRDMEGFGMVLLEAQASGLPVIAGASGGTGDAVSDGKTGYVVDCSRPQQPDVLVQRVADLLDSPELRTRMGQAGIEWSGEFDWRGVASRAQHVFRDLAARR